MADHPAITRLREMLGDPDLAVSQFHGQFTVRLQHDKMHDAMQFLRDDPACSFEQLTDLSCVDYLHFRGARDRFGITYLLLSIAHNHRLTLKVMVNDPEPSVPTVTDLWSGAEWLEREVFDMFGVKFIGHPDLRRILCDSSVITENPLRKDYPLRGKRERESFEVVTPEST